MCTRIVIWSPNYAPEPTGIPPLVTDAAEWLAAHGHQIDVVTAFPNYPQREIHPDYKGALWRSELQGDVHVHRSWLRARPERSFVDKALYELTISTFALPNAARLFRQADAVVCVVPTLLAATYAAALRKIISRRLILWVQDLVLEAASSVGVDGAAGHALRAARKLEHFSARAADAIAVCSPGFADYFIEQGISPAKVETIYNWADTDTIRPTPGATNGHPRFLYAGNLGFTQGLETLIDAAKLGGDGITVEIVGAGNASDSVRQRASHVANVTVREPVPRDAYPSLLASADAHVVVQRKISAGANLPSKIATYMASGKPIVASIDDSTPAARLLKESGGAILVPPESPDALARAMREIAGDHTLRADLGRNGRAYAEKNLSKDAALERLERVIVG